MEAQRDALLEPEPGQRFAIQGARVQYIDGGFVAFRVVEQVEHEAVVFGGVTRWFRPAKALVR